MGRVAPIILCAPPNPPHAEILLAYLSQLPTLPETQITTSHPFDLFQQANVDLIHPPNIIHT
jgi:hypothetical protein